MIKKDLYTYINQIFHDDLQPISILSKSTNGKILVDDKRVLFNFDEITKKLYNHTNAPASADSIFITDKIVLFTEFKTGFQRKISKKTLDLNLLKCPKNPSITCTDYAKLLIDKNNLEIDELLDSLKFKAIESYVTLEKKLLPLCDSLSENKQLRVIFCVVIDDYIDNMEDTLLELADAESDSNSFSKIKSSLSRFVKLKDSQSNDFYYDEIKILSPYEFSQYIPHTTPVDSFSRR